MRRLAFALIVICGCFQTHFVNAADNELVTRIVKYFPGKWEYKSDDGTSEGSVDWTALAGGTCIGGPGMTENGASFSFAGWDPEKKFWLHIWHGANGQFGRLEVQRFEGDTYYGMVRVVEGDGSALEFKWENKIVDKDHFVLSQRTGDEVMVSHWHRKK